MESQVGHCGLLQQPLVVFGDKANHEADVRPEARLFCLVSFFMFGKVIMEACYSWAKNVKV